MSVEVAAVFEVFFIVAVFGDVFVVEIFESAAQVRIIGISVVIAQINDIKTKKTQIFFRYIDPVRTCRERQE